MDEAAARQLAAVKALTATAAEAEAAAPVAAVGLWLRPRRAPIL